ncbi:hypothetical protein [Streptosporangium sp. NPDC049046]|uniref:hypothetical protein n=1 Tax=Streptosporangium sp. NPDC049046 TaxID=3155031 RepID=UPI00342E25C6
MADLADEAAFGPARQLPIHRVQGDVAEVEGDVAGVPEPVGMFVDQCQDAVVAALVRGGVPVVAGGGGECVRGIEEGDIEAGDGAAAIGSARRGGVLCSGTWVT